MEQPNIVFGNSILALNIANNSKEYGLTIANLPTAQETRATYLFEMKRILNI